MRPLFPTATAIQAARLIVERGPAEVRTDLLDPLRQGPLAPQPDEGPAPTGRTRALDRLRRQRALWAALPKRGRKA